MSARLDIVQAGIGAVREAAAAGAEWCQPGLTIFEHWPVFNACPPPAWGGAVILHCI